VLKRAVNAQLHALRSYKRGQFGRLLHKMKVWATSGGVGIGRATVLLFGEGGGRAVIEGRRPHQSRCCVYYGAIFAIAGSVGLLFIPGKRNRSPVDG